MLMLKKQENIIKLLCVDEANKEYIVIIVFSRKKNFDLRGFAYLTDTFSIQIDEEGNVTQIFASSNQHSY